MNNDSGVWLIFLGSFLTFLATALIEYFKSRMLWRQKRSSFLVYIRFELQGLLSSYEKLKWNLENKSYFDFLIINRLNQTIRNLEESKRDAFYINDNRMQERLINTLSASTLFLNDIQGLENFASDESKKIKEDTRSSSILKNNKSIDPSLLRESIFKDEKDYADYFKAKRIEKQIELVDLIRSTQEVLKELLSKQA